MSSLLTPSKAYKPFRYPWAYDFWLRQQQVHWLPEEVPLGEDVKDWAHKLTDKERNLLSQIFRFFTQSDVEVGANYMENFIPLFKPVEVRMMLAAFSNMETVHMAAYALLLETIGMPESEFSAFREYQEMADQFDYLDNFKTNYDVDDILVSMAVFGAFIEGLQLFASFAMLMNFPRFGKMKGMGQIVSWSVRDESLHCEGMIKMFHTFAGEHGGVSEEAEERILDACDAIVTMEDRFIDLAFAAGEIQGMTPDDIKQYIRYIADWRLGQLKIEPIYGVAKHPLPWLTEILNGVEHANFFEARATEYSKGATQGSWEETWAIFAKA